MQSCRFRGWDFRGLVLASIFAVLALDSPGASAQGLLQDLFGGGGGYSDYGYPYPGYRYRHGYAPERGSRRRARSFRLTPHHSPNAFAGRDRHRASRQRAQSARDGRDSRDGAVRAEPTSASRSYCVRECDGYFFPVGYYSGSSDAASHQRTCDKLCPGARAVLYVMRSGSDKIEDAVKARGGGAYSRLRATLHRRGGAGKEADCSCRGDARRETPTSAIYHDFTLRRGDAVMTQNGMEVFHGGRRFPYSRNNFRPLAQSRDVPAQTRRKLATLERASRHGRVVVERRAGGKPLGEHRSQKSGGRRRRH